VARVSGIALPQILPDVATVPADIADIPVAIAAVVTEVAADLVSLTSGGLGCRQRWGANDQ
jgi:hypothetical protein